MDLNYCTKLLQNLLLLMSLLMLLMLLVLLMLLMLLLLMLLVLVLLVLLMLLLLLLVLLLDAVAPATRFTGGITFFPVASGHAKVAPSGGGAGASTGRRQLGGALTVLLCVVARLGVDRVRAPPSAGRGRRA